VDTAEFSQHDIHRSFDLLRLVEGRFSQLLVAKTQDLYKRQNILLPFHKLPPELISEIFQCYLTLMDTADFSTTTTMDSSSEPETSPQRFVDVLWNLAKVCTHWWSIVTSSPRLWAMIMADDPLELMIRKSKNAPLSVRFFPPLPHHAPEQLDIIYAHSTQWRSLYFVDNDITSIAPYLTRSLYRLEEIHIRNTSDIPQDVRGFRGGPSLRFIHLHAVLARWDTALLSNVTVLCLTGVEETSEFLRGILIALRRSDNLHELVLQVYPGADEAQPDIAPTQFHLPLLTDVRIESSGRSCLTSTLFPRLLIPKIQRLHIDVWDSSEGPAVLVGAHILSKLAWNRALLEILDVTFDGDRLGLSESGIILKLTLPAAPEKLPQILRTLGALPLSIRLDLSSCTAPLFSARLLDSMPNVSDMKLAAKQGKVITRLSLPRSDDTGGYDWACPHLETLTICGPGKLGTKRLPDLEAVLNTRACHLFLQKRYALGDAQAKVGGDHDPHSCTDTNNEYPDLKVTEEATGKVWVASQVRFQLP
ncbi:hypothetical protein FRB99_008553, partial [Tulasnella sp. 403]